MSNWKDTDFFTLLFHYYCNQYSYTNNMMTDIRKIYFRYFRLFDFIDSTILLISKEHNFYTEGGSSHLCRINIVFTVLDSKYDIEEYFINRKEAGKWFLSTFGEFPDMFEVVFDPYSGLEI